MLCLAESRSARRKVSTICAVSRDQSNHMVKRELRTVTTVATNGWSVPVSGNT